MIAKFIIQTLLRAFGTGIKFNGPNPWDPQIHNNRFYWRVLLRGSIALGDSYTGRIDENGKPWWTCKELDVFFFRFLSSGMTDFIPRAGTWRIKIREMLEKLRGGVRTEEDVFASRSRRTLQ